MVSKFYFIKVWLCQNQNFYNIVIQSEAKNLKASTEYTTNALQILHPPSFRALNSPHSARRDI